MVSRGHNEPRDYRAIIVDIGTVGKEVEELKEPMRTDDNVGEVMFWGKVCNALSIRSVKCELRSDPHKEPFAV